jgi:hypothetical protein
MKLSPHKFFFNIMGAKLGFGQISLKVNTYKNEKLLLITQIEIDFN